MRIKEETVLLTLIETLIVNFCKIFIKRSKISAADKRLNSIRWNIQEKAFITLQKLPFIEEWSLPSNSLTKITRYVPDSEVETKASSAKLYRRSPVIAQRHHWLQ